MGIVLRLTCSNIVPYLYFRKLEGAMQRGCGSASAVELNWRHWVERKKGRAIIEFVVVLWKEQTTHNKSLVVLWYASSLGQSECVSSGWCIVHKKALRRRPGKLISLRYTAIVSKEWSIDVLPWIRAGDIQKWNHIQWRTSEMTSDGGVITISCQRSEE